MRFIYIICLFSFLITGFKPQENKAFTNFQEALKSPNAVSVLKLNGCEGISSEELEKIKAFKNLKSLEISECSTIKKIPDNITCLQQLKRLAFYWNGGG